MTPAAALSRPEMFAKIQEAQKHSPEAFQLLKKSAIVTASVALGILLAIPTASVVTLAGLSFPVLFLASTAVWTVASCLIIDHLEEKKQLIGYKIAQIILQKNDVIIKSQNNEIQSVGSTQTYQNENQVALIIGINYNKWEKPLTHCVNDVKFHIRDVLVKMGFVNQHITMMSDEDVIKGEHYPTRNNILRQLDQLVLLANKHKTAYFHYSGLSSQVDDESGVEIDRKDEILVPINYRELKQKHLNEERVVSDDDDNDSVTSLEEYELEKDARIIEEKKPYISDNILLNRVIKRMDKDVFFVITTDCGKKGTLFNLPFLIQDDGSMKVVNHSLIPDKESLGECDKLPFVVKFSGCVKNKKGRRITSINGHQAGAFTAAYWATLQKYRYKITYRQLLDGIRAYLNGNNPKKRTYNQYPQLTTTRPIDLDSYFMRSDTHFVRDNNSSFQDKEVIFTEM